MQRQYESICIEHYSRMQGSASYSVHYIYTVYNSRYERKRKTISLFSKFCSFHFLHLYVYSSKNICKHKIPKLTSAFYKNKNKKLQTKSLNVFCHMTSIHAVQYLSVYFLVYIIEKELFANQLNMSETPTIDTPKYVNKM